MRSLGREQVLNDYPKILQTADALLLIRLLLLLIRLLVDMLDVVSWSSCRLVKDIRDALVRLRVLLKRVILLQLLVSLLL